MPGI
jgi:predicted GH43/DUF377 family glycosyl hydrolase